MSKVPNPSPSQRISRHTLLAAFAGDNHPSPVLQSVLPHSAICQIASTEPRAADSYEGVSLRPILPTNQIRLHSFEGPCRADRWKASGIQFATLNSRPRDALIKST